MGKERMAKNRWIDCSVKFFCLLFVTLLMNGCSSHDQKFSYFNMLDEKKRTAGNKEAAEKFWSSVRPSSTLADSHYRLGRHYQHTGEHDKAIREFTKSLDRDLSFCKAHNGIAMSYDALRDCQAAHASYDKAVSCAPHQAYVYNNYACSSLLCGDYDKGLELFLKAEELAQDNTRIKNNLGVAQSLVNKGDTSGGVSATEKIEDSFAESDKVAAVPGGDNTLDNSVDTTSDNTGQTISVNDPWTQSRPVETAPAPGDLAGGAVEELIAPPAPSAAEKVMLVADKKKRIIDENLDAESPNRSKYAIEVSNGNGAVGMAGRSAAYLRGLGFKVRSITNAKTFNVQESKIFYQEGCLKMAKALAATIPGLQNLERVEANGKASIGVKVLLGKDLADRRFPENVKGIVGQSDENMLKIPEKDLVVVNSSGGY